MMSTTTRSLLMFALAAASTVEAQYTCYGTYCRRRRGLRGGAIAGIAIAGAALLFLLLLCCFLRRARRMRFRSRAAGAAAPGRQIGFMYFPTQQEHRGGAPGTGASPYGAGTTPGMAETGTGASHGPAFPQAHTTGEGVASPPPVYKQEGQYAPPSGVPPTEPSPYGAQTGAAGASYAPPTGPPPTRV